MIFLDGIHSHSSFQGFNTIDHCLCRRKPNPPTRFGGLGKIRKILGRIKEKLAFGPP
jgi:hypothetical protein